jgi:membrane protein implicated in regulation of membrane protease activity
MTPMRERGIMSPMQKKFLVTLTWCAVIAAIAYDAYFCAAVIPEPWGFVVFSVQAFIGASLWESYRAKNEARTATGR